jgi:UDP-glucose 4-epimerase
VLDAIRPLAARDGYEVKIDFAPARRFDVPANVLDSSKLSQHCGWAATVAFEDGLSAMWHDIRSRHAR